MNRCADLEIRIPRYGAPEEDGYTIEMRLGLPKSDAESLLVREGQTTLTFDNEAFRRRALDDEGYGRLLTETLFASAEAREGYTQAFSAAAALKLPLRIRLFLSTPRLHTLQWERMLDPQDGSVLSTRERVYVSRYIGSKDLRPVELRARVELRALIAVCNPEGLQQYGLEQICVADEVTRAKQALGDIDAKDLAKSGPITLNRILTELRTGYDILYLIAHGKYGTDGDLCIFLEGEEKPVDRVASKEFSRRVAELPMRPRLVVLASCMSAETSATADDGTLSTLGPLLARAGIPAVIGMQGNVSQHTAGAFVETFFRELRSDGIIDRSVTVARQTVRERPDWWMPVLFMRLKGGSISWYDPSFSSTNGGGPHEEWPKWPSLVNNIRQGECTPIIGGGVLDDLVGSRQRIARILAQRHKFPMPSYEHDNLPRVLQYLATNQDLAFPPAELLKEMEKGFRHSLKVSSGEDPPADMPLGQLASKAGWFVREGDMFDSLRVLAELPLPIYLTTEPTDLLSDALKDMGKSPRSEMLRWRKELSDIPSHFAGDKPYEPSAEEPLVFQLFGNLSEPVSLVLTEDDYCEYVMGVTRNSGVIPSVVKAALANTALVFLGFRLSDWNFRILFRSLLDREGAALRRRYAHVAAQAAPQDGAPDKLRAYLETSFEADRVTIFWGGVRDLMKELKAHLGETG